MARVNPPRSVEGDPPSFDDLLSSMTERARGMNVDRIRPEDRARSGGAPDEEASQAQGLHCQSRAAASDASSKQTPKGRSGLRWRRTGRGFRTALQPCVDGVAVQG
jgi:hypothetical protein